MVDRDTALLDVEALLEDVQDPLPTEEELHAQCLALFKWLDADGDGRLTTTELQAALEGLGLPNGNAYIRDLMSQYDVDGDGAVTFTEFEMYVQRKERILWDAFRRVDVDKNGHLDRHEVQRAFQGLGLAVEPADVTRLMRLLDENNDDVISYAEFKRFAVLLPQNHMRGRGILAAMMDSADWHESMEYRLCHIPASQPVARFLAGGVAGAVSRTVVAPFERLRTIMMADPTANKLIPTMRRMWLDGGLVGMFRGNGMTVLKVFPASAIQFAVYDSIKDALLGASQHSAPQLSTVQQLGAGMAAGAAATMATYPLEMLRTQISVGHTGSPTGSTMGYATIIHNLVQQRGVRALYQGFTPGLVNNSMTQALGFCFYEGLCAGYRTHISHGEALSTSTRGLLGGVAAFGVMTATMPLEVVMRRMQVQGSPGYPTRHTSGWQLATCMLREEGLASFWRGSLSSYMKVVPSIAAVRFLYEGLVSWYGIGGVRRYRRAEDAS